MSVEARAATVRTILGAEALVQRLGLNRRAVHAEALAAHEAPACCTTAPKAVMPRRRSADRGSWKHRMVPHRIVYAKPDETTEQQVVVQLLDQQTNSRSERTG